MNISIGEAAALLGVSLSTMRRWEKSGQLAPDFRTIGGHRRYHFEKISKLANRSEAKSSASGDVVAYSRVSGHDQLADRKRQTAKLVAYCESRGWTPLVIEDLGSGLNYKKKGFRKLFKMILKGEVSTLVLTHKDRLLSFGSDMVFDLCEMMGTKVIIVEDDPNLSDNEHLVNDVVELMTVFSARLHGRRSHAHKSPHAA